MRSRWLFAITILGFSFAAAYLGGMAAKKVKGTEQAQEVIGGLMIPTDNLDMGEVWEAKDFSWRLPIRNLSDRTIEIRKFLSSCVCTAIDPPRLSIPPGETVMVNLVLDLMSRHSF